MSKVTQKDLALAFIKEFGGIVPAKMSGKVYRGIMFGHSIDVRCRELRSDGFLMDHPEGKFIRFIASDKLKEEWEDQMDALELKKIITRKSYVC